MTVIFKRDDQRARELSSGKAWRDGMFKEESVVFKITEFNFFLCLGASYLRGCRKIPRPRIDGYIRCTESSFEYRLDIVDLIKYRLTNKS